MPVISQAQGYRDSTKWDLTYTPVTFIAEAFVQGGYAFSLSEKAPLDINKYFYYQPLSSDFLKYSAILERLQNAPATWTMQPQFTLGTNFVELRKNNFGGGLEADISYLSYASQQTAAFKNQQARLDFNGTEWRWKFKIVLAYRIKKIMLRIGYGFTSGFAKNYHATLRVDDGTTSTLPANQDYFRKTDFGLVYGAGMGYELNKNWQLMAIWEGNSVTTSKYTSESAWFGKTTHINFFLANQLSLRLCYRLQNKERSALVNVRKKPKNR